MSWNWAKNDTCTHSCVSHSIANPTDVKRRAKLTGARSSSFVRKKIFCSQNKFHFVESSFLVGSSHSLFPVIFVQKNDRNANTSIKILFPHKFKIVRTEWKRWFLLWINCKMFSIRSAPIRFSCHKSLYLERRYVWQINGHPARAHIVMCDKRRRGETKCNAFAWRLIFFHVLSIAPHDIVNKFKWRLRISFYSLCFTSKSNACNFTASLCNSLKPTALVLLMLFLCTHYAWMEFLNAFFSSSKNNKTTIHKIIWAFVQINLTLFHFRHPAHSKMTEFWQKFGDRKFSGPLLFTTRHWHCNQATIGAATDLLSIEWQGPSFVRTR